MEPESSPEPPIFPALSVENPAADHANMGLGRREICQSAGRLGKIYSKQYFFGADPPSAGYSGFVTFRGMKPALFQGFLAVFWLVCP
jgi:hypothetical protein